MRYLDITLPNLPDNLALDEALLLEAEAGRSGEMLRVWEWPTPAVILGAGCSLERDVVEYACQRDDVPIVRRSSGGGTVLLGRGCLLFSFVMSYERSQDLMGVRSSYRFILERVRDALRASGADVELAGVSDLAIACRKFSGNAQQRKRHFLLHHGTLLYNFDTDSVSRYLRIPSREPDYRQRRLHAEFLTNIPATSQALKNMLCSGWRTEPAECKIPVELVERLSAEKYNRPEWTWRR